MRKYVKEQHECVVLNYYSWSEAEKVVTLQKIQVDLQDQSPKAVTKPSENRKESDRMLVPNAGNACGKESEKRWLT